MTNQYGLEVGDSFELTNGYGIHLHIIVAAESDADNSQIIIVYVSSSNTKYKDLTTIIQPGEHPYITRVDAESWVRYQNTRICSRSDIASEISFYYGKVSPDLLTRIQRGLLASGNVSRQIKRIFNEWKMNKLFDTL